MPLSRADRPFHAVHRADLIDILATACREAGVAFRLNTRVEAVEVDGVETVLTLSDTMPERHGLTFAADGIHSPARAALNPRSRAWFTGQVAWRATVPDAGDLAAEAHVFMGPGRHLVRYPLRQSRLVNIVAVEGTGRLGPGRLAPYRRSRQPAPRLHRFLPRAARPARPGGNRPSLGPLPPSCRDGLDARAARAFWATRRTRRCPSSPRARTWRWRMPGASWPHWPATPTPPTPSPPMPSCAVRARPASCRRPRANATNYHLRPGPWRFAAHSALRLAQRVAPHAVTGRFDWLHGHDVTRGLILHLSENTRGGARGGEGPPRSRRQPKAPQSSV